MSTEVLDTRGFDAFISSLVEMSGASRKKVLLEQAARVLEICVKRSPGKSSGEIRKKVQLRVEKPGRWIGPGATLVTKATGMLVPLPVEPPYLQTLTGTRGGSRGEKWFILGRRRDGSRIIVNARKLRRGTRFETLISLQKQVASELAPKVPEAIAAVGSVKRSWVQIADRLGVPLRIPGGSFVRKGSSRYDDGARSRYAREGPAEFVEIVNTNGMLIQHYDGAAILQGAIDTRLKAFERETRTGVFDDLAYRARRYPGIFVS